MIASKHPEVLRQIREEHDAVFHKSFEDTITMLQNEPQRLSQLNYTTAVIKETLRLFPPGFAIHEAPKR
jgi:cytochrome P450